jgi:hypothetical protein
MCHWNPSSHGLEIAREKQYHVRLRAWMQVRDSVIQLLVDVVMTPARALAPTPWAHQRWATYLKFERGAEKTTLVPVLIVDFRRTWSPSCWMME